MNDTQFKQFMEFQQQMLKSILDKNSDNNQPNYSTQEITVNTALLSNFEIFDPSKESFRNYKARFENYLEMKNIINNKDYCAKLLLNSIGAKFFNMISALSAPKLPKEKTYDELITLLEKHLAPEKNILVAQHKFLSKYQQDNQSISEYVAALRADIGDCNFISNCDCKSSIADIFLRAQFIRGIKDNSIREKLLQSETKKFDEIVSKALILEASKIDSKELAQRAPHTTSDINKIKKSNKNYKNNYRNQNQRSSAANQNNSKKWEPKIDYAKLGIDGLCLRCGRNNHLVKDCRINKENLKCSDCNKTGHVAKVCIRSLLDRKSNNSRKTNLIQAEATTREYGMSNQIVDAYQNRQLDADMERYFIQVNVEGKPVKFEVDTGSGYTFLPRRKFAELNFNAPAELSTLHFRSYTGNIFIPDGKFKVNIEYNGNLSQDDIYIVPNKYDAILGRSWIRKLNIKLNDIDQQKTTEKGNNTVCSINETNEIITQFSDIFEEKVGCVPNLKVSLKLREKANPIFLKEREIPFALYNRVEEELDSLKEAGIITKTETRTPMKKTRQLSVGERVEARYYTSNKQCWKFGTIIKKFGRLHYLVQLDNGYTLKRHIDQLRSTEVLPPTSGQQPKSTESEEKLESSQPYNRDELQDLVIMPRNQLGMQNRNENIQVNEPEVPEVNIEQEVDNYQEPPTERVQIPRRASRTSQLPKHLQDHILKIQC